MTSWWEVVILVVAVIGSGLIGAYIAMRRARRDEAGRYVDGWLPSVSDARFVERRASVYFEVAVGWHAYLELVRPLAYPAEGPPTQRPRDLSAVLRSRAELEQFGTIAAQRLHDEALDGAVTLINILRALPKLRGSGAPDLVLGRQSLRALLFQLERQGRRARSPDGPGSAAGTAARRPPRGTHGAYQSHGCGGCGPSHAGPVALDPVRFDRDSPGADARNQEARHPGGSGSAKGSLAPHVVGAGVVVRAGDSALAATVSPSPGGSSPGRRRRDRRWLHRAVVGDPARGDRSGASHRRARARDGRLRRQRPQRWVRDDDGRPQPARPRAQGGRRRRQGDPRGDGRDPGGHRAFLRSGGDRRRVTRPGLLTVSNGPEQDVRIRQDLEAAARLGLDDVAPAERGGVSRDGSGRRSSPGPLRAERAPGRPGGPRAAGWPGPRSDAGSRSTSTARDTRT